MYGANNHLCVVALKPTLRVVGCLTGHKPGERTTAVAFCHHASHPHWVVSGGSDGAVKLWDTEKMVNVKTVSQQVRQLRNAHKVARHHMRFVVGTKGGLRCIWSAMPPQR